MEKLAQEDQAHSASSGETCRARFDGMLRDDLWKYSFHGRNSKSIHSRFMMPFCSRYSSGE